MLFIWSSSISFPFTLVFELESINLRFVKFPENNINKLVKKNKSLLTNFFIKHDLIRFDLIHFWVNNILFLELRVCLILSFLLLLVLFILAGIKYLLYPRCYHLYFSMIFRSNSVLLSYWYIHNFQVIELTKCLSIGRAYLCFQVFINR